MTFAAFITLIFLQTSPISPQEAQAIATELDVCEETTMIYNQGITPAQLDQMIRDEGWDPETEFAHAGCNYQEGGVELDDNEAL